MFYPTVASFSLLLIIGTCVFVNQISAETDCKKSRKHYANLCFSPGPITEFKDSVLTNQLSRGWFVELGNDVARLHYSEAIMGHDLTYKSNYSNSCERVTVKVLDTGDYGCTFSGFGNLYANCNCPPSKSFPRVLDCELVNTVNRYRKTYRYHTTYTDNKNMVIAILCFSDGQVGWVAFSVLQHFTVAERKLVVDYITSLGFSNDDTVVMYDSASCPN